MTKQFVMRYKQILDMALSGGIRSVPVRGNDFVKPFMNKKHRREFLAACHRGYEKAQHSIVEEIIKIRNDNSLSDKDKKYRILLYRKIVDAIAFVLLGLKTYVARRLSIHDFPTNIDTNLLPKYLEAAESMNRESRQTFALITDLTTFIHVGDILRIDFSNIYSSPKVSIIELKTGKVNQMLLEALNKYDAKKETLNLLKKDISIEKRYKTQAERMLKQRVRLAQIEGVLKKEKDLNTCVDIKLDETIKFTKSEVIEEKYDDFINKLCDEAEKNGAASGTIENCLHIGVGCSSERKQSVLLAKKAAEFALFSSWGSPPEGLTELGKELLPLVPREELFRMVNPFAGNLLVVFCRPFPLWHVNPEHIFKLITGEMHILTVFDIAGFIYLGRSLGFQVGLSTTKEASEKRKKYGSAMVPTWGSRGVVMEIGSVKFFMFSGMLSKFLFSLTSPRMAFDKETYRFE